MKWSVLVFLAAFLIFLIVPVQAVDYVCDSCSNCTSTIQNNASSGDSVILTTDIGFAGPGACINMSVDSVTFDCQRNRITGPGALYFGIWLESDNSVVRDCIIEDFGYGIFLMGNHNLIDDVVCQTNAWAGIDILGEVTNNTVRNSNFKSNTGQDGYGIFLTGNVTYNNFINVTLDLNARGLSTQSSSNYNTFTDLNVNGNTEYGIEINESSDNEITDSLIENNPVGISIGDGAVSNMIYNNYFDNTNNARVYADSGVNDWNTTKTAGTNIIGDSYLGGNSWSDYSGQDLDGDGLGDTSYSLGASNYDYLPLIHPPFLINFALPTPSNESTLSTDWIFVNASANRELGGCILEWNGTNESMSVGSGDSHCSINKTGLGDDDYWFKIWADDGDGNESATGTRVVTINTTIVTDTAPPTMQYTLQPSLVVNGSNVSIGINATDPSGVDTVWVVITLPDSSSDTIYLTNDQLTNYTTSPVGRYNITFFANDTLGNEASTSDYFNAAGSMEPVNFTITVLNNSGGGIEFNLTIYEAGTTNILAEYSSDNGTIDEQIMEGDYDLFFDSYTGSLQVLLRGVNISDIVNKEIQLDRSPPVSGYSQTYAVDTDYGMSTASVRISYIVSLFNNESYIGVYVCNNWNFTARICNATWAKITPTQNLTADYFDIEVTGFSAFSLKQETYCGDGTCDDDEDSSSCSDDCECDEGDTRPCSDNYEGWCGRGDETCVSGEWAGCPLSQTEVCDGEDNDCDGVIDNVGGGTSVSATQCACYNGADPGDEVCNGIDDDCDGDVDEGGDCCTNGNTRDCGPSEEIGICKTGTSTCTDNVWGACDGAVSPKDEICGNGEDDDCDGETDEECFAIDWFAIMLIAIGVIILVVIIILYLHFKKQGKELTWKELQKKWAPSSPSY